jgi:hypothetical protein
MINGSDDAPVGNLLLDRNGVFWPVAAGASNCAGKGGPASFSRGTIPLDSGNTRGWQIEVANNGVGEIWPSVQIDAYFAGSNALNAHVGNRPDDVISHAGWTDRKIDPATAAAVQGSWVPRSINSSGTWNLDDIRDECWSRSIDNPPPRPPDTEEDVQLVIISPDGANARFLGCKITQTTTAPDGSTGERIFIPWCEWVDGNDPLQYNRFLAYQNMGVPPYVCGLADLAGMALLGPIPSGDALKVWSRADFGNVLA